MSNEVFPINKYNNFPRKVVDGFTIYKSQRKWHAIVVIETNYGIQVKLYSWIKRKEEWRVDLANINIGFWDWKSISNKLSKLKCKYLL